MPHAYHRRWQFSETHDCVHFKIWATYFPTQTYENWCCCLHENPHAEATLWWGQSAENRYMLCDLQLLLIEVQWLACVSKKTTFLLEVSTAKPWHWSMGPQSWACSWANQILMCLLRDPAVHQSLLHHSGWRDGLSAWRTSDTWCPQMGQEILSKGWWG